jgi:uncharacterized membrane protein YedE/YeeE
MHNFTPWAGAAGGALIGLAALLLLGLNGRIAGVSGVVAGLWFSKRSEKPWRLAFLLGLVLGTALWLVLSGQGAPRREGFPPAALVVAGLLVGYGTALAGGCTSGHGVCGLARLSLRSLVATATFLGVALLTTLVARHLLHLG